MSLYYFFLALITKNGSKVATRKDKNNNDWEIKGVINSLGIKIPISKLFEKSGEGKNKIPLMHALLSAITKNKKLKVNY